MIGFKPHVLGYLEPEFKVIKPHKGGSLQRFYWNRVVDIILRIKRLLYEEGYTIFGAKRKIKDLERTEPQKVPLRLVEKRPKE